MGIFEELQERGLIAQVTDEDQIKNLIQGLTQQPIVYMWGILWRFAL